MVNEEIICWINFWELVVCCWFFFLKIIECVYRIVREFDINIFDLILGFFVLRFVYIYKCILNIVVMIDDFIGVVIYLFFYILLIFVCLFNLKFVRILFGMMKYLIELE